VNNSDSLQEFSFLFKKKNLVPKKNLAARNECFVTINQHFVGIKKRLFDITAKLHKPPYLHKLPK